MLKVENLGVSFVTRMGTNKAVDGISFTVETGKITAIIGESGSGKSVACYSLLGLVPQPPGRIDSGRAFFNGQDLLQLKPEELRKIRGRDIAMVFQDPMTCLNPYMTVGKQLMEPLRYHHNVSHEQARARAIELMEEVGLRDPATTIDNYPHQFSGGMRQRIMIAMALINEPQLLIADEPTFISHDLAVVADIADQILVMQEGRIVETGNREDIFHNAQHPYTRKLLNAIPRGGKPVELPASEPLVTVRNLCTWFHSGKSPVKAVDDVSFDILRGEVLGLVGESGSGKSTIGRSLLRLVPVTSGRVQFDGIDVTALRGRELKNLRRRMQFIFQDPFASLNPRMTVYDTLAEPLLLHGLETRKTVGAHVLQLMDDVGLARAFVRKYPHEFSGGQRQRIAIGRALATRPEFVVADEPVSALDVTIQAQVLELMRELGREYGLTMLFISHDLAVVRQLADRIIVLNKGKVVEQARTEDLFERPQQTYTQQLLQSIPGRALMGINTTDSSSNALS